MEPLISRMSTKRRVTIPLPVRRHLALQPGDQVEFQQTDRGWRMYRVDSKNNALVRSSFADATLVTSNSDRYIAWTVASVPENEE